MYKNEIFKSKSAVNQEIKRIKFEKEELAAGFTQDMTVRLSVRVAQLLNGGSESPTIDELAKMTLTMREISANQQYSLLIEKSAGKLHKELLLKKNHKKFYENFAYSAKEIAEFITYKNSQKAVDKRV